MSKVKLLLSFFVLAVIVGGTLYYYRSAEGKSAPALTQATSRTALVFVSPPRETPEEGELTYRPIAEYLTKVIGKPVVYEHPATWGLYRTEMLNGDYDIIFDGGHFADYRAQKLGYHIVAKMPQLQEFAIIVRADDKIAAVSDLAGQTVCAPPPPNQGALLMMAQFPDPNKQPLVVPVTGDFWAAVYKNVLAGQCRAGVLVVANLEKFNKDGAARVLYKTPPQPNQAWSIGPRVSAEDRAKIAAALTSPDAAKPTEKLRERFKIGERFVTASNAEYAGLGDVLKNEWGFSSAKQ